MTTGAGQVEEYTMRTCGSEMFCDLARASTQLAPVAGQYADDALRRLPPEEQLALLGAVTALRIALDEMRQVRTRLVEQLDAAEAALTGSDESGNLASQRDALREDVREIDRHLSERPEELLERAVAALRLAVPSALQAEAERARRTAADEIGKLRTRAPVILRPLDEYAALAQRARSALGPGFATPAIMVDRDLWAQVASAPEPTIV